MDINYIILQFAFWMDIFQNRISLWVPVINGFCGVKTVDSN